LNAVLADWVDVSPDGDGSQRVSLAELPSALAGRPGAAATRYFGPGDVLRNAALEFGEKTSVEIESRFENCTVAIGEGTQLVIGGDGVLKDCQVTGAGEITVHGSFFEREKPGITGVKKLVVSAKGSIVSSVVQAVDGTVFGFEPGCRLRIKISGAR